MKDITRPRQKACPNCNKKLSHVLGDKEPQVQDISVCCHCGVFLMTSLEGFSVVPDSQVVHTKDEREAIWEMRKIILKKSRFSPFIGEICMN
jgi:hypothetical protein